MQANAEQSISFVDYVRMNGIEPSGAKMSRFFQKFIATTALCSLSLFLLLIFDNRPVWAEKIKLDSKYLQITFNSEDDIRKFNKSIEFDTGGPLKGFFSSESPGEIPQKLVRKLDLLFEKVQTILDMRKPMENKIRVLVYSNEEELNQMFLKIFKKQGSVRSWYVFEYNTVYLNVDDVHEGMLAHELAHAIIDHFMSVRPPRATAEILASYVDKHLLEEVRTY